MTLEVVHGHAKLAPESGLQFRPVAPISGAGFRSVCQGLKPLCGRRGKERCETVKTRPRLSICIAFKSLEPSTVLYIRFLVLKTRPVAEKLQCKT